VRRLRMVWEVERDGLASLLVGTAHFFPVSYARHLRALLRDVDSAAFEGPLDEESLRRIAEHGRRGDDGPDLLGMLDPGAVSELGRRLERRLGGGVSRPSLLLHEPTDGERFRELVRGMRPWMAFFSVWSACLGWEHSVDREGYEAARRLGIRIRFLESVEEQLRVLDGIPAERIARQLNDVRGWPAYTKAYVARYRAGDLDGLLELAANFHFRRRPRITPRDGVLFDRIREIARAERVAAFVGFPHVPGILAKFGEAGWRARPVAR